MSKTIHSSLLLSNFSVLPGYRKTIAAAAAKRSMKHLAALSQFIVNPDFPAEQIVALLPALYPNLDPGPIPDVDALDDLISAGVKVPVIEGAFIALNALASICRLGLFPSDAAPDLWPRVWPWIQFLHTYCGYLPGVPPPHLEEEMCTHDAYILMTLANHQPTGRNIYATYGVRSLLVRAWKIQLSQRSPSPVFEDGVFQDAGRILNMLSFDSENPLNNEEVLDSIGGNLDDLATAVVAHLKRGTELPKSEITIACQGSAITFCKERDADGGLLRDSLLAHGIVPSLVEAIIAFDGVTIPAAAQVIKPTIRYAFDELMKYVRTPPGFPSVAEALRAGLLRVIISFGAGAVPDKMDACNVYFHLEELLCGTIPGALVYCGVVTQIKESVTEIIITPAFKRSPLFQAWDNLVSLVEKRVAVFDTWNAVGRVSSRACDNMECCSIDRKDKFKRCANCKSVEYCSRKCQAADWQNGHRESCAELASVRRRHPETLNPRERSFMRTVLHHEFEQLIYNTSYQQVQFLHKHPEVQFFTHFDFTRPFGVPTQVHQIPALAATQPDELKLGMATLPARAARSGGDLNCTSYSLPRDASGGCTCFRCGPRAVRSTTGCGASLPRLEMRIFRTRSRRCIII